MKTLTDASLQEIVPYISWIATVRLFMFKMQPTKTPNTPVPTIFFYIRLHIRL